MRSYSRARSLANDLAQLAAAEPPNVDSSRADLHDVMQHNLSNVLEEIRQHLGDSAVAQEADAFADDDIPRFVSQAIDADADAEYISRAVPALQQSRSIQRFKQQQAAKTWAPVLAFVGCVVPVLAGLGVFVAAYPLEHRLASVDGLLGPRSISTQDEAVLTLTQRLDEQEIAAAINAPPGPDQTPIPADAVAEVASAAAATVAPARAKLDIAALIELTTPATDSAALAALSGLKSGIIGPELAPPLVDIAAAPAELVIDSTVPLLISAVEAAMIDAPLADFQIAWADSREPSPVPQIAPQQQAASLLPAAPVEATAVLGPLSSQQPKLESRVVGSLRSTSARQGVATEFAPIDKPQARVRPRPVQAMVEVSAFHASNQDTKPKDQASAPTKPITAAARLEPRAVTVLKRVRPRPSRKTSASFLAAQNLKKAKVASPKVTPARAAPQPPIADAAQVSNPPSVKPTAEGPNVTDPAKSAPRAWEKRLYLQ